MGDLVNLRRARKERARREKNAQAETNRVAFGRSKTERETTAALNQFAAARLDAHKRDRKEDETE